MRHNALSSVLFWCLFPLWIHNLGNKHQNNTLVGALTVQPSILYIIVCACNIRYIGRFYYKT